MLRLKPTVLALTAAEIQEYEDRWRHRQIAQEAVDDELHDSRPARTTPRQESRVRAPPASPKSRSLSNSKASDVSARGPQDPLGTPASQSLVGHEMGSAHEFSEPTSSQAPGIQNESLIAQDGISTARRVRISRPRLASSRVASGGRHAGTGHFEPEQPDDFVYSPSDLEDIEASHAMSASVSRSRIRPEAPPWHPSTDTTLSLSSVVIIPKFPLPASHTPTGLPAAAADEFKSPRVANGTHAASTATVNLPRTPATPPRSSSLQGHNDISPFSASSGGSRTRSIIETVRPLLSRTISTGRAPRRRIEVGLGGDSPSRAATAAGSPPGPHLMAPPQIDGASSAFQVYNDALPATAQPQTPQNLPEARHRGRLLDSGGIGAHTAPVWRTGITAASGGGPSGAGTTRRRYPSRRQPSPAGLDTPGFRGLYGGLENTDDATLFNQASRLAG